MANEIVINEGRPGAIAAQALVAGDCVVFDAAGKWDLAGAASEYMAVMFTGAASGTRASAEMRKGHEVRAMSDGSGTAIAVGNVLEMGAGGRLVVRTTGTALAVAKSANAAADTLIKVVML